MKLEVFKAYILKGLSREEIFSKIFGDDENADVAEATKLYLAAKKAIEADGILESKAAETKKAENLKVEAKKLADAALKEIPVQSILEKAIESGKVQVKEPKDAWKKDVADYVKNLVVLKKTGNPVALKNLQDLTERAKKVRESMGLKATSIRSDSDVDGGFLIRPEFDMEMDKLIFKRSMLLDAIQFRTGNDKTLIDGISNFDFTFRADQDTDFTETKPTFTQQELNYREAGAIVPVSNFALEGSEFNLVSELLENAADANIRLLEPLITTGNVDAPDNDVFDGFRFHDGITTRASIAAGLESKDLTNAYLAAPPQSRQDGSFVLDTRELCLLLEERDNQNLPIETILNINGAWIHKKTGRPIIVSDLMSRTNNALVDNSTGTDVGAFFVPLNRFRIYRDGTMQVDTSDQIFFKQNAIGLRFITRIKWGIPSNSRSSFVTLTGVKNTPIT
ncbi:hypothetical protein LCGC14_0452480 [marine sediment metagenome]|uniref:Phage capsid-like C-terminal domain-containing protein n=1 Tax=marine sediment metagenome TaxID=412755 RepID=A0A0F9T0U5_9ZZZZ